MGDTRRLKSVTELDGIILSVRAYLNDFTDHQLDELAHLAQQELQDRDVSKETE